FPSIEALHAADDEWRKFIAPAQADARVGLTDAERALIERAEERLRGRSPEDASVANGLLEVLIAHPGQPKPRAGCDSQVKT
ncbi:TPA: hypothetical protein QDB14_006110, partial [Burkholderia vietnamiensis]|nr:hypothetical protein [Burkholderia vietnamiensis]